MSCVPNDAPPTPTSPTDSTAADRRWSWLAAAVVLAIAAISTSAWLGLRQWYGIGENRDNPRFSFEKIPGWWESPIMKDTFALMILIGVAYALAIMVMSLRVRHSRWMWLSLAALIAGPAAVNIAMYPVGALDVFNYLTELKIAFHYGENPYLHTFESRWPSDSYAAPAFLMNVTLFYGPAWLLFSGLAADVVGWTDYLQSLYALKVFNVALIAITAAAIAWFHRDSQHRWLAVTLFAANPLVWFEGVGNGHNDVLLTCFVVTAMVALERKSPLAGPLLALSALVKLYTVALLPIFIVVALRERWSWKRIALTVGLTAVAVVATCAPYWGEGKLVDGMRAGLEESQEMDHVSLLSLMRQYEQNEAAHDRPDTEYALSRPSFEIIPQGIQDQIDRDFTIAFIVITLLIAVAVWRGHSPALGAAETLLVLFLLMTNLYGWYLIPVIALVALKPDLISRSYAVLASCLALIYYPMFVFGHYNSGWSRFHIHQFLALFLTAPILLYLASRVFAWVWTLAAQSLPQRTPQDPAWNLGPESKRPV